MKKSTIIHTTILSGQNINVPAPHAEEALIIQSSPAGNLNFQFDISAASPEREGNDLVLNTEGGTVLIGGFFEVGDESLPSLTLEDGTVLDATDFFAGTGLDLTTAAGEAESVESSGTNYGDEAGALLLGVDRLDMLDSEAANAGGTESLSLASVAGSDLLLPSDLSDPTMPPTIPIDPTMPSEPEEEIFPHPIGFDLRAVLYRPSGSSDDELHLNILDAFTPDSSRRGPSVAIEHAEHANGYFTFDPDNPFDASGNLVLTLTDEGKDKLQSRGGESIYDYITIKINGEEPGHTIQVVANGNGRFNTGYEHPSGFLAEGVLAFGEWHQGQASAIDFNEHYIKSSELDDSFKLTGNLTGSSLALDAGDDSFKLTGNLTNSSIDMGTGDDSFKLTGNLTGSSIDMGVGDDTVHIDGDMKASSISLGVGKNSVSINGVMLSEGNTKNIITADSGTVYIGKGVQALDNGQNIIKTGYDKADGDISINVNSKNGADIFGVQAVNGSSKGFSNELQAGGKLTITGSRFDNQHDANAQTTVIKGVSADGARNSLSAEDSILIKVENKSANSAESYGVEATASGENHFRGDTTISSIAAKSKTGSEGDVLAHGVKADDYGKNIFKGDLDIKSQASGDYNYDTAESYGLYAGSSGQNIMNGGLTVLSSASGSYGTSYGVLAENHGINQVGEMYNLSQGDISIKTHGLRGHYNYGKEGNSIGVEASEDGQNLFYTTGNVYMLTGGSAGKENQVNSAIGLHAKDGGLNRIYTDGGNIEFEAKGYNFDKEQVSSTVRADNGINIVETTSGNISMKSWDGNRAYALEAMNNGENHIITQTGDIHLWGQPKSTSWYDGIVSAESGGVNYIGNVRHDANGKPIDQNLITEGINVTIESGYSGVNWLRFALEAKDGGTNVIRTNAGNDAIRLIGAVHGTGSGKNIIDAGEGNNSIKIEGTATNAEISTGSGNDTITIDGNLYNVNIDAGTGHDIIKGFVFHNNDINNRHYIRSEYGEINIQKIHSEFDRSAVLERSGDIYSTIETIGADVNVTAGKGQDYTTMRAYTFKGGPNNEYSVNAHNVIKTDSGNVNLNLTNTQLANSMEAIGGSSNTIETNSGDVTLNAVNRVDSTAGANMFTSKWDTYKETPSALNQISTKTGNISLEIKSGSSAYNMRGYGGANLITTEDGNIRLDAVGLSYSSSYNMYAQTYGQNKIVATGNGDISLNSYKWDPYYDSNGNVRASNAYGLFVHGDASNVIESKAGDIRINVGFSTDPDKDHSLEAVGNSVGMGTQVFVNDSETVKEGDSGYVSKDAVALNRISSDSGDIYIEAKGTYGAIGMSASRASNDREKDAKSTNIIETKSGDINISALTYESTNPNSGATGMFAEYGGKNIISAFKDGENPNYNNISITITAKGNKLSQAMRAENDGENQITTGQGDDTITLTGDIYAASGGVNRIETHGGDDTITLTGDLYAVNGGENYITTGQGADRIQIDGSVRAGYNSSNEILTGAGDDTLIINGGLFAGIIGYASKSKNIIDTGSGDDKVIINGGIFGLSSSEQIIGLGDGHDIITINGDIELQGDGKLSIDAGEGNDIIFFNGKVIGSGTLTVDGGTGDDQLVLQASDLSEFIERYGAWLKQPGLIKNIDSIKFEGLSETDRAELQSGGFLDNLDGITIYIDNEHTINPADLESFSALDGINYSGEFSEEVTGLTGMEFKNGDDRLVFHSKLSNSILNMGEGDDLIVINSNMESVQLNMGEGNDSLYINHAVLDSQINMGSGDDHLYINSDFFDPDSFDPAGSSFDGGEGNDTLHLQVSGEIKLSEVTDLFKGFETIDLSGGGDSVLDIDSLIGKTEKTLMIKGDEGQDKVSLSEDWSYKETQVHDDVSYGVYSHGEDDAAALILIQLGLMN